MWQAEFKLYLYPNNPTYSYQQDKIVGFLKNLSFIDQHIAHNRYATGDHFLSHVTFMGCSPDIELTPQDNSPYCYIEFEQQDKPLFIVGHNIKQATCYHCKQRTDNPELCPNCNKTLDPLRLNWRKTAFYARSWIAIGNIYELEAIPNDLFLSALEKETGVRWKPAYIHDKLNAHGH